MTKLVIHGLRRSGTTILWETLRSNENLRCYDEPFHPRLAEGIRQNHKGTWTEFDTVLDELPATPVAISPSGELDRQASLPECQWLAALCNSDRDVVIDIVRGWNRIPTLHEAQKDLVAIHLVRDPANWVAAHLLPSGAKTFRRRVAGVYRKTSFFSRRGFYDNYQYQTIIDAALESRHPVFSFVTLSHEDLMVAPAYIKLLAFWWGSNVTLSKSLKALSAPSMTVTLADFTQDPSREITRIAESAGWSDKLFDTSKVRPSKNAFGTEAKQWIQACRRLGIPETLVDPAHRSADSINLAFKSAHS